jgi:RNA polymerase sigma-70 factor (ECF subfamily)
MEKENDLLKKASRMDQEALAEIYDRFSPGVYRYALRQLGDAALAEDCVAETFSRFLKALSRGGGPRRYLQAYLYRTAHNWISDHFRRKTHDLVPFDPGAIVDPSPPPEQKAVARAEQRQVQEALAELTPDQRQVVVLKYLEGWSNQDIAVTMDKTVGAVKALQNRALSGLKRQLLREEKVI